MTSINSALPQTMRLIILARMGGRAAQRATTILADMYQRYVERQHWGQIFLDRLTTPHGDWRRN